MRSGEVMALVGDNGAGKSTLIKCIAGIHPIDAGEIVFDGQPVSIGGPKDAARLGIEVVYQDLALCDNLDVVQNMYLGREAHDVFQRLQEPPMEATDPETLKSLSVTTISSIRQTRGEPLGWPAPVGRRCPRGDVELGASSSSTSRPRRSGSRRPSRFSSSCGGSPSRASRWC